MSFVFERVIKETLEVESVIRNFMNYGTFYRVRKDKPTCGFCQKDFQAEDNTNMAFVKGRTNEMICDDCADTSIVGGAEEVIRSKEEKGYGK